MSIEQLYHQAMSEETINLDSVKDPAILIEMAISLETEKQYGKMSQVFLKIIEIQDDYENAWFGLGFVLDEQGKLEQAVAAYQKQLEICPQHEHTWNSLGITLAKQGKLEQAQDAYAQIFKINPNYLWALSNYAELALIQQDRVRCQQRMTQALTVVDNRNDLFVILPFLAWIAEPESNYQPILKAIENLKNNVKIGWGFSTLEPAILRLTAKQQIIARQFIGYFQGKNDAPK